MLEKCSNEELWTGVDSMIERWLDERQTVIVQYCALSGVNKFSPDSKGLKVRLDSFCQLLVDYVSAGHFEIYYELMREAESFNDGTIEAIKSIVPRIHATTEKSLDFNDIYTGELDDECRQKLPQALSKLGEIFATRFDLEDRLIADIHSVHKEQVA